MLFLNVSENLEKSFSKIGFYIHDMNLEAKDEIRLHIENFSLQVLTGPYKIRALGCFDYNCSAAKTVRT